MRRILLCLAGCAVFSGPAVAGGYDDFNHGLTAYHFERYDEAIGFFTSALASTELIPDLRSVALLDRGLVYQEKKQFDLAKADLGAAEKASPNDVAVLEAHAVLYRDLGQYDVAMADAAHAIQEAPARPLLYFLRCQIDFEAAQYQVAASDCGSYLHLAPTDGYGVLWMAMSLARGKQDLSPAFASLDRINTSYWPGPLIDLYRSDGTPESVKVEWAKDRYGDEGDAQKGRICETDFYGGEWHLVRGETAAAKAMLAAVPGECPKDYIEIDGAKAELARLK
ncbi:MAG: hypothetical protein KGL29_06240 [Alphaproteobacteria bacterium]|nr:hypothetical protein [Alphaproteobacteria bacterium]